MNKVAVRQSDVVTVSVYTVTVRVTVYTVAVWQDCCNCDCVHNDSVTVSACIVTVSVTE